MTLVCHICSKRGFTQKRNLREHYATHDWLLLPGTKGRSKASNCYGPVSTKDSATITLYQCPSCPSRHESLEHLGNHIKQSHLQSDKVESER